MTALFVVFLRVGKTDKYGTQHREDIRLDKSHKQLQTVHEDYHHNRYSAQSCANHCAQLARDKYHASQRQNNGMARKDIGKQTHHQGKRLCQYTKQLNHRHHRHRTFAPRRNLRPKDLKPIFSVAKQVDGKESKHGQNKRNGNIAREVGTTGKYRNKS